jgi:hypothetical protein
MMLPSAAPMILPVRDGQSQAARNRPSHVATSIFAVGYLAAWAGFSLVAAILQWEYLRITWRAHPSAPAAAGPGPAGSRRASAPGPPPAPAPARSRRAGGSWPAERRILARRYRRFLAVHGLLLSSRAAADVARAGACSGSPTSALPASRPGAVLRRQNACESQSM